MNRGAMKRSGMNRGDINQGMSLSHTQAQELIQKSLETRLDAFESAALSAHLAGCVECATYATQTRALDHRLGQSLAERWPERKYTAAELERRLASMQSRLRRESMFGKASSFARLAGAVAVLILLIVGLAWLVRGTTRQPVSGVSGGPAATAIHGLVPATATEITPPARGISLEEAGKLVREWVYTNNPGMSADAQFPLQEITTDDLWQRMQAQAYQVTNGVMMYESFLIKDGQVYKLGEAFGGMGIGSLKVTDLDGNGSPELVFTYSFGSGIHQSSLGLVTEQNGQVTVQQAADLRYPNDLGLEKQDDRTLVLKEFPDKQVPEGITVGMVRLLNNRLVIAPDLVEMTSYNSARFELSFIYPADWKLANGQTDVEGYSGPGGYFALFPIQQPASDTSDMTRACEWLANGSPAMYGDLPLISLVTFNDNREGCLVRTTSNNPDARSALLLPVQEGRLALLTMDPSHAQVIVQSIRFSGALPTMTPAAVDMTPRSPSSGGEMVTRRLGDLTLSEYAVVPASEDTPGHFEFNARIPEAILQRRIGWSVDAMENGLDEANIQLEPFGYRLEKGSNFDLYKDGKLFKSSISNYFPVSAYRDEQGGGDFAMLVEDNQGRWLVRKAGIQPWDDMLHRFTRPVMVGVRLITVERANDPNSPTDRLVVKQDGQPIFTYTLAPSPVEEVVKTLAEWNGGWVLEVNGTLIVNGTIYNQKDFQTDEIFNWTVLSGKPFFFFRRDGKVGAWYDGKELPVQYDEIIHNRCCEPAAFNVVSSPDSLWFYALKNGMWYFVELGNKN